MQHMLFYVMWEQLFAGAQPCSPWHLFTPIKASKVHQPFSYISVVSRCFLLTAEKKNLSIIVSTVAFKSLVKSMNSNEQPSTNSLHLCISYITPEKIWGIVFGIVDDYVCNTINTLIVQTSHLPEQMRYVVQSEETMNE